MKKILLVVIFSFTFLNIIPQNEVSDLRELNQHVITITTKQDRIELGNKYIGVYKDSAGSKTNAEINSLTSEQFISLANFKYEFKKETNYWLTFQTKNISDINGEWVLEFRDLPYIDIFIIDHSNNTEYFRAGTMVPASEKQMNIGIREALFFTLKSNEIKTFYVKFHYLFDTPTINPISISDTKSYIKQTTIDNILQGIFQGLLWMMLLYNLFLFISTRQKSYLYYIFYVFSFSMLMLYAFQYLSDFIFPEHPKNSSYFGIFVFAAFVFYFQLLREFIDSRNAHPKLDKSLRIIFLFDLIVTVVVFIIQFISIESYALVGMEYAFLNVIALLVYVAIIFKIGNKVSKIFALGTSFLVLCISIAIIKTYMGGDADELILLFQAGIVAKFLFFSAGLSYKYRVTEQQKQKAQEGLIVQLEENHKLQTKVNRELEQEVSKRTEEINEQKEELYSLLENLKQAQSQLVQNEKMAGIGQLTAGIAHEINNPINYVSTGSSALKKNINDYHKILDLYAEISNENIKEKLSKIAQLKKDIDYIEIKTETEKLLNNIQTGSKKVTEIVKSLRTFTRLDENDLKTVDLKVNIDATLAILNNRMGAHIKIEKQYGDNVEIECFPGKLNQVFLNILNNSIDAMENGGEIIVQTQLNSKTCQVSISDTGIGIPKEIQNRIFEPFFTTKDVGKGKGLGLSTAHSIIKEHHGSIELESEVDKGTTFTIIIPVNYSSK